MENPVFRQCGGVCGGVVRKGVYVYVAGGGCTTCGVCVDVVV